MYIEKHIPNKRKGEKMILFLRRHWIVILGHWFFYTILLFLPIALYYLVLKITPESIDLVYNNYFLYPAMLLIAGIYYLYIWLLFYHAFIDYYLDVWIVTNKRVINIEQKGLFNRLISEHELEKIQDVTGFQKGIIQTFLSFGDVHVQTAGEVQRFVFRQVNDPFEVIKIINHLLQDIRTEKEKQNNQQNTNL